MIPSIFVEAGNAPSRTTQMPSETSFQTKKELFSIYLQEAKLRKELETPIDDDKPNPLRTYQRMEHELAERRKFFSFNGLTRCKSLPSIYNPTLHSQRQQSTIAFKMESTTHPPTPSIKEPLFTKRTNLSLQELAKSLRDSSDAKKSAPSFKAAPSSRPDDKAVRKIKCHPGLKRTKSDLPGTSKQRWKITIHKRLPTVIWPFSSDPEIKLVTLSDNCYTLPCKSVERICMTLR